MNKRLSTIIIGFIVLAVFLCLFVLVWNFSPTQGSQGSPHLATSQVQPSGIPVPTLSPEG